MLTIASIREWIFASDFIRSIQECAWADVGEYYYEKNFLFS